MAVCRVHDFSFTDLLQPTATRFREQLSAAINFIMFSDVVVDQLRVYRDKKVGNANCIATSRIN